MRHHQQTNGHAAGPDDEAFRDGLIARGEELQARREGTTEQPRIGLEFPNSIEIETACGDLVKHIVSLGALVALYGPSGVGKTFLAILIAIMIALGLPIGGRRTRRAPVLYVALEGQQGVRKRIRAAVDEYGDPGRFFARMIAPAILNKTDAGAAGVRAVVAHARALTEEAGETVGLIIIDTLARAMAGDDENSAQDMGAFVEQRAAEIIRQTGAAVLVVHHTGKDAARGMRGSYSLFGAADAVIRIDESKTVELEKVKDGPGGAWFSYELPQVTLGTDDDGDPITTCTVKVAEAETGPRKRQQKPLTRPVKRALRVLEDIYSDDGAIEVPAASLNLDGMAPHKLPRVVEIERFKAGCSAARLSAEGKPNAERMAFERAVATLEDVGAIARFGEWIWLAAQQRRTPA